MDAVQKISLMTRGRQIQLRLRGLSRNGLGGGAGGGGEGEGERGGGGGATGGGGGGGAYQILTFSSLTQMSENGESALECVISQRFGEDFEAFLESESPSHSAYQEGADLQHLSRILDGKISKVVETARASLAHTVRNKLIQDSQTENTSNLQPQHVAYLKLVLLKTGFLSVMERFYPARVTWSEDFKCPTCEIQFQDQDHLYHNKKFINGDMWRDEETEQDLRKRLQRKFPERDPDCK